jgi:hypothetical protein
VVKNLMKRVSSREDRFPKTLFAVSRCKIIEDDGSRDLLSRSQMHVNEQDEVASAAQQQKRRNLDVLVFFMAVHVTTTVATLFMYNYYINSVSKDYDDS